MKVYAVPGQSELFVIPQGMRPPEGAVPMLQDRPSFDAIALADGTWGYSASPDLALGEVENIVAMFPASYGFILERLGFGDVV